MSTTNQKPPDMTALQRPLWRRDAARTYASPKEALMGTVSTMAIDRADFANKTLLGANKVMERAAAKK